MGLFLWLVWACFGLVCWYPDLWGLLPFLCWFLGLVFLPLCWFGMLVWFGAFLRLYGLVCCNGFPFPCLLPFASHPFPSLQSFPQPAPTSKTTTNRTNRTTSRMDQTPTTRASESYANGWRTMSERTKNDRPGRTKPTEPAENDRIKFFAIFFISSCICQKLSPSLH